MGLSGIKLGIIVILVGLLLLIACTPNKSAQDSFFVCKQLTEFGNNSLLGMLASNCFSELAGAKKDLTLCDKIDNDYERGQCYSNALSGSDIVNPQWCEILSDKSQKAGCYSMIAINTRERSFCEKADEILASNIPGQGCHIFDLTSKDISICEEKEDTNIGLNSKGNCYFEFAMVTTKASLCNKIPSDYQSVKDYCLGNVATRQRDVSICKEISGEQDRNKCYFILGVMNDDSSSCNKILNTESYKDNFYWSNKDRCIFLIAMAKGDYSLCGDLSEECDGLECMLFSKSGCYLLMGGALGDTDSCDNLDKDEMKGVCYSFVGFKKKDALICNELEGESKDACFEGMVKLDIS